MKYMYYANLFLETLTGVLKEEVNKKVTNETKEEIQDLYDAIDIYKNFDRYEEFKDEFYDPIYLEEVFEKYVDAKYFKRHIYELCANYAKEHHYNARDWEIGLMIIKFDLEEIYSIHQSYKTENENYSYLYDKVLEDEEYDYILSKLTRG